MTNRAVAVVALVLAACLTGACGAEEGNAMPDPSSAAPRGGGGAPSPTQPAATPPTPPKVGPSTPSDYIEGDTIGGRVVKGGSGPCYAVINDDNLRFALHNDAGLTLEEGSYITAKVAPLRAKIDCGEGTPYELISFKRL